jgi:hypothetical protein
MATQQDLSREANARFWITTFYKPGTPLDPADSADKFMARRWLEIYRDLARQNARGTLTLIHKHPSFSARLNDAIRAYQVESTINVTDPRRVEARAAKAQALNEAAMWHEMLVGSAKMA